MYGIEAYGQLLGGLILHDQTSIVYIQTGRRLFAIEPVPLLTEVWLDVMSWGLLILVLAVALFFSQNETSDLKSVLHELNAELHWEYIPMHLRLITRASFE